MRLLKPKSNTAVLERVQEIPDETEVIPEFDLRYRAGVAEDLILINGWFQSPIINRFSQMPKTWKDTLNWWRSLKDDNIISMLYITDKSFPKSLNCGRTIGYIQLSQLDKEPYLFIVIGDFSLHAMGIGSKAVEIAGSQLISLKKSKFYSVLHPEHKIGLSFVNKYQEMGIVQSVTPMDSGWIRIQGDFLR